MKKFIDLLLSGTFVFFAHIGLIWGVLIAVTNSKTSYVYPLLFVALAAISMIYSLLKTPKD